MQSHYYPFHGHPISQPCGPQDASVKEKEKKKKKKKQPESTENPTEMKPNARA